VSASIVTLTPKTHRFFHQLDTAQAADCVPTLSAQSLDRAVILLCLSGDLLIRLSHETSGDPVQSHGSPAQD
jgi:hypothetical protein